MSNPILDYKKIVSRIADLLGVENNDVAIGEYFGRKRSAVAMWRKGVKIPIDGLVKLSHEKGVSLDYILLGITEDEKMRIEIDKWRNKYYELLEQHNKVQSEYNQLLKETKQAPFADQSFGIGRAKAQK